MESHPYETTVFNAVANAVLTVQDRMRAAAVGSVSVSIVDEIVNDVVNSAQDQLDMYYEAEEL